MKLQSIDPTNGELIQSFDEISDADLEAALSRAQQTRALATDVASLAALLRETAEHHGHYEKTDAEHRWSDWYAPYLSVRQSGSSPEEAVAAADRHMEKFLQV